MKLPMTDTGREGDLLWKVGQEAPELLGASFDHSPRTSYLALRERMQSSAASPEAIRRLEALCSYSIGVAVVGFCESLTADSNGEDLQMLAACSVYGYPTSPGRRAAVLLLALGEVCGHWSPADLGSAISALGASVPEELPGDIGSARRELSVYASLFQRTGEGDALHDLREVLGDIRAERAPIARTCSFIEVVTSLSTKRDLLFVTPDDAMDAYLPDPLDGSDRIESAIENAKAQGDVASTDLILALDRIMNLPDSSNRKGALWAIIRGGIEGIDAADVLIEELLMEGTIVPQEVPIHEFADGKGSARLWLEERLLEVRRRKVASSRNSNPSAANFYLALLGEGVDRASTGATAVLQSVDLPKLAEYWNVAKVSPLTLRNRCTEYRGMALGDLASDAESLGILTREQRGLLCSVPLTREQAKGATDMLVSLLSIFRYRLSESNPDLPAEDFAAVSPHLISLMMKGWGVVPFPAPKTLVVYGASGESVNVPSERLSIPAVQLLLGLESPAHRLEFAAALARRDELPPSLDLYSDDTGPRAVIALACGGAGTFTSDYMRANWERVGQLLGKLANESIAREDRYLCYQLTECIERLTFRSPALERFVLHQFTPAIQGGDERRLLRLLSLCGVGGGEALRLLEEKLRGDNAAAAARALGHLGERAAPLLERAFDYVPIVSVTDQFDKKARPLTEFHQIICDGLARMGKTGALALLRIEMTHEFDTDKPLLRRVLKEAGETGLGFDRTDLLARCQARYGGLIGELRSLALSGNHRASYALSSLEGRGATLGT